MAHPPGRPNYEAWSSDELRRAELTASRFLEQNSPKIAKNVRAKLRYIDMLAGRIDNRSATLDQRLECFARIAEIAQMIKDEADGFFELGSQPVVARVLSRIDDRKP